MFPFVGRIGRQERVGIHTIAEDDVCGVGHFVRRITT